MELIPLRSERVPSGSELRSTLVQALKQNNCELVSGDIVVMASKVVAYCQGLLRSVEDSVAFRQMVKDEADQVFDEGDMVLTLKHKILIPNAGVDKSNVPQGQAILWPERPFEVARELWQALRSDFHLSEGGVVISDSACLPLRRGTVGLALGWAGFEGVVDERGATDLYGQAMKYTTVGVADQLASAANLLMGETDASIPFVVIRGFQAQFTARDFDETDYFMPPSDCLFRPFYRGLTFH